MLGLRIDTPDSWSALALEALDDFLRDHATNERKVAQSALRLAAQHPQRDELVTALGAVAAEEVEHFRQVHALLRERGQSLGFEQPDRYMVELMGAIKSADVETFLLDRLVLFGIIEARGCERFSLMAKALTAAGEREMGAFYEDLTRSEARHHALYLRLARVYFPAERVAARHDELLDLEAKVLATLPLRPALH